MAAGSLLYSVVGHRLSNLNVSNADQSLSFSSPVIHQNVDWGYIPPVINDHQLTVPTLLLNAKLVYCIPTICR